MRSAMVCEAGIAFGGAEPERRLPAGVLLSRLAGMFWGTEGGAREGRAGGSSSHGSEAPPETVYHEPVMVREVVEQLRPREGAWILDCTLGGGGHAEALLDAGACVAGIDQDCEAVAWSRRRLARFGDRFLALQGNASDLPGLLKGKFEAPAFEGMLVDLGVSSRQLDDAERGFSFLREGPLRMTMDPGAGLTAEDVVNDWPEGDLERILREWGEERMARRIVREIVRRRARGRLRTTRELADCVAAAVPRTGGRHPATKTFQAIRIAVNYEITALRSVLEHAPRWLRAGSRLVVISYHSLEDREVKTFLQHRSARWLDRPEWPEPRANPDWAFRLPVRGALRPTQEETARNPRARSARLRVGERLPDSL